MIFKDDVFSQKIRFFCPPRIAWGVIWAINLTFKAVRTQLVG